MCNEWKWFATFTIAKDNYDRKNLDGFYERFSEWLKYMKKKSGKKIPYLLVPEQHGDGSWHMHGFFNSDIDQFLVPFKDLWEAGADIPFRLAQNDYYNWPEYTAALLAPERVCIVPGQSQIGLAWVIR